MYKWAIVETYYKRAEYSLTICYSDEDLEAYIMDKLLNDYEYSIDEKAKYSLEDLINLAESIGNERVEDEIGWGIREIRKIE